MNKKILIGIPTLSEIKADTVTSIFGAVNLLQAEAVLHIYKTSLVHDARNKIVERALKEDFTHLLFVDDDMNFDKGGMQKLLDDDKDVVGGLYFRKVPPHHPNCMEMRGKRLRFPMVLPKTKLFEVFAVGMGLTLIKSEVLKSMKDRWFFYNDIHGQTVGEDVYFCNKARNKGFTVWVDPTIPIQHIGDYGYDRQDYEIYHTTESDAAQEENLFDDILDGNL